MLLGGGEGEQSEGLAYYAGAMTTDALQDWIIRALEAGSVIAMPAETNRWSYADNTPGATWAPSTGAANLTRTGAPGAVTRQMNRA